MRRYIHIFHTNDVHSWLDQTPYIATTIQTLRQQAMDNEAGVITVDMGDHVDRMRAETEATAGQVNMAIMQETGYELVTLGNNEGLTFPREMLNHLYDNAVFDVVLSNWWDLESGERPTWVTPYVIREWFGCRVAFIGLTIPFNDFYHLLGWSVADPFDTARELVRELKTDHSANVVVVLSHLGLHWDEQLADTVPGIDLILGGHTHHVFPEGVKRGNTYLGAAGKFGEYVGEVRLTVDEASGALLDICGGCHSVKKSAKSHLGGGDLKIHRLLAHYEYEAEKELAQTVVEIRQKLPLSWEVESPLGNVLADSLLTKVEADAALVNTGQLLEGLPSGIVTRKDLHRICPSPVNPCRMRLMGGQIRKALEESLLPEFQYMPIRGFGFRGSKLGVLAVSNMRMTYRPSAAPYEKITDLHLGEAPLENDRWYDIATIDMFTFGVGYQSLKEGKDVLFYLPDFLRDSLAVQLQQQKGNDPFVKRWHPES